MTESMLADTPLWVPSPSRIEAANVTALGRRIAQRYDIEISDYAALYRFSLDRMGDFWDCVWEFGEVIGERGNGVALSERGSMQDARWFDGARLSFAENLLRREGSELAATFWNESGPVLRLSCDDLRASAARMARALLRMGVKEGDRVAAYMPNIPEALIGMLGCASIGAIWSICATDLAPEAVVKRFVQIEPAVLLLSDGASYGGRIHDARAKGVKIAAALSGVRHVVAVDYLMRDTSGPEEWSNFSRWTDVLEREDASAYPYPRFPFNHPLYVLYTSGTTGDPKCIVHGAGGTLLKHIADHLLQFDVRPLDTIFRVTGSGWMLWNSLMSGLACGAALVLYDGSPTQAPAVVLDIAEREGVTLLGLSPQVIETWMRNALEPALTHGLSALRCIAAGGAPLSRDIATWVHARMKSDVHLVSPSGGTDIVSFFVAGHPTAPTYAGQIQSAALGMAVDVFDDDGKPVRGRPGELVCKRPFPSMPLGFWGDMDGKRMHSAYFETWPGIWRHGDWAEVTPQGGYVIHGRSDATLKVNGVRIGTAEIYAHLTGFSEILACAAVNQRHQNGLQIALFIVLAPDHVLDDALQFRIRQAIARGASPRHVPRVIYEVPDLPRTSNGKCSETAIRAAIHGEPVRNEATLANPQALVALRRFHMPSHNSGDAHA